MPAIVADRECCFALGHIGAIAAARDEQPVCVGAARALLEVACADREPGALFISYMTSLRVKHSALTNLIRLCSSPSSAAATPRVHGSPHNLVPGKGYADPASEHPPPWAVATSRGMAAEAAFRLCTLCAGAEANASRRAVLALLEGAAWGFELPQEGEPSAYLHHAPMLPPQ